MEYADGDNLAERSKLGQCHNGQLGIAVTIKFHGSNVQQPASKAQYSHTSFATCVPAALMSFVLPLIVLPSIPIPYT